jgi:hypothetical protein
LAKILSSYSCERLLQTPDAQPSHRPTPVALTYGCSPFVKII